MKSKQENQNRVFNKKKYDIPKDMEKHYYHEQRAWLKEKNTCSIFKMDNFFLKNMK